MTYNSKLLTYKTPTTYAIPWSFQPKDVFSRINEYLGRLHDIKTIFQAASDFFMLEKVEVGGINGRNLNRRKVAVLNEYQMLFNAWSSIDFDPLNGPSKKFLRAKAEYQHKAESLERKLAQIIDESFDGCFTAEHSLKLLEMIGPLAYRPIIHKQIEHRFEIVFQYYGEELDTVEDYFDGSMEKLKLVGYQV